MTSQLNPTLTNLSYAKLSVKLNGLRITCVRTSRMQAPEPNIFD